MDARSTPIINSDFNSHKNSETSISSEDVLTSSEHLFSAHDTIDLSPDPKQPDKDYVRISKQEYEEIKSRVSAIENRLSREFTDIPRVQPLQQVQNVYEQTLEEVAMLNYPTSDHLARRLSKELKIRPEEQAKIIRSPSARKIGTIRRRSKENVTKVVRHKSWNASSQPQANQNADRFYPYVGISRRERTDSAKPQLIVAKVRKSDWNSSTENSLNTSDASQKYQLRKRVSIASEYNLDRTIGKPQPRRSLNIAMNSSWDATSDNSMNTTKSINNSNQNYMNIKVGKSPSQSQPKWRSAAAFFMDKTGEVENTSQSGRPSVNKLRRQNAGGVLAKAKLFESSSDKSSERNEKLGHTGFARRPRISGQQQIKTQKNVAYVKPKIQNTTEDVAPRIPLRNNKNEASNQPLRSYRPQATSAKEDCRANRKTTPPIRKVISPQNMPKTPQPPSLRKPLCTSRTLRTPASTNDLRKANTPLKAVHVSPRRRSPRQKLQR